MNLYIYLVKILFLAKYAISYVEIILNWINKKKKGPVFIKSKINKKKIKIKKNLHRAGFEPAKLLHKILSLTPLTAREPMLMNYLSMSAQ